MESPPSAQPAEPRSRTKSASRMSKLRHCSQESGGQIPKLSLDLVPCSPRVSTPSPASTLSPRPLPLRELLMLSPSPLKRSKKRLSDKVEMADDALIEACGVRKRRKSRNASSGCVPSPRSNRKSRRTLERDMREERDIGGLVGEEALGKPRKKRHGGRSRKVESISAPSPRTADQDDGCSLHVIEEFINDLVMWKDVSKSTLWFGVGLLGILSSCFTKGVSFSLFSFLSQVGLLFLAISFFSNSMRRRDGSEKGDFKLKEEDILKLGRLILPAANYSLMKTREVFSGEPATTLKAIPFLLVGVEYGHLMTMWRLFALSFFLGFTVPKLYSAYSAQLFKKVEYIKSGGLEAWGACTHKKIVAASAITAFWNLTAIRTRILAAFICLVIVRYHKQHSGVKTGESIEVKGKEEPLAIVANETQPQK